MPPTLKRLYRRAFPSRVEERSAYFKPPLIGWRRRLHAWFDMLAMDHGFIRYVYTNFHKVDDKLYRSSQPLPHQVRKWQRMGVKTIINLRGGMQYGSYPLEVEAAEQAGIAFEGLQLRSRALPDVAQLEKLETLLKSIAYPAVIHCKAGADRASLGSALYFLILHNDYERAQPDDAEIWPYQRLKDRGFGRHGRDLCARWRAPGADLHAMGARRLRPASHRGRLQAEDAVILLRRHGPAPGMKKARLPAPCVKTKRRYSPSSRARHVHNPPHR